MCVSVRVCVCYTLVFVHIYINTHNTLHNMWSHHVKVHLCVWLPVNKLCRLVVAPGLRIVLIPKQAALVICFYLSTLDIPVWQKEYIVSDWLIWNNLCFCFLTSNLTSYKITSVLILRIIFLLHISSTLKYCFNWGNMRWVDKMHKFSHKRHK